MARRVFVLINTVPEKSEKVQTALKGMKDFASVDQVTPPYDIIAVMEAGDEEHQPDAHGGGHALFLEEVVRVPETLRRNHKTGAVHHDDSQADEAQRGDQENGVLRPFRCVIIHPPSSATRSRSL